MNTISRDVTLRFYRLCPVNECEVERSNTAHKYKLTEPSIGRWQRFVRRNKIELEVDFIYFTEISFHFDKEVYEPEDEVQS